MNKYYIYFVSGHRDITLEEFEVHYIPQLNKVIENPKAFFVVGDYEGVDKMTMDYLAAKQVNLVIYHMFDNPQNYPATKNNCTSYVGGFTSDEKRDSAMTSVSNYDIAWVRPGKEDSGTQQNINRRRLQNVNK